MLDVAFGIPVSKWEPDNDAMLAEAFTYASPKMPVVTAFVPSRPTRRTRVRRAGQYAGLRLRPAAMANLTDDADDFVRRQELIEAPKAGVRPNR